MQTGKCSKLQIEIRADRNLCRSNTEQSEIFADPKIAERKLCRSKSVQTGKCSRLQIEIRADRNLSRSKSVQIGKGADRKKSISKPYCPTFKLLHDLSRIEILINTKKAMKWSRPKACMVSVVIIFVFFLSAWVCYRVCSRQMAFTFIQSLLSYLQ